MSGRLCLSLVLLTGCASMPQGDAPQLAQSAECDRTAEAAIATGLFTSGDFPKQEWWKELEDPLLDQLIESALTSHPTLAEARSRLEAAAQVAVQTRSTLFPELDFAADNNWQHLAKDGFFRAFAKTVPAVVNDVHLGLSFSYDFDFWGKNRDLLRAALGEAAALYAEQLQTELVLSSSIAYTYTQVQLLMRKRGVLQKIGDNTRSIEQILKKRELHALNNALSSLDAQANTLIIERELAMIDQEIELGLHKLKALSNLGQDADLFLSTTLHPLIPQVPEHLCLDLLARRPDLIAQKARVEAAAQRVSAAKTDFYPNVNLMGLIGWESIHWSNLFQSKNYSASIDPAIHLPLFTAGRIRAHYREEGARFESALFAYNSLVLSAAQEVVDRLTDYTLLHKQATLQKLTCATTEEIVEKVERRKHYAIGDSLSLFSAENSLLTRQLTLIELEYGQQLASILLVRALGGGACD